MPPTQPAYFFASDLSGAVPSAIPTISYAFATNDFNSFGIDATYTGYGNDPSNCVFQSLLN
jgi:hypothetical protein